MSTQINNTFFTNCRLKVALYSMFNITKAATSTGVTPWISDAVDILRGLFTAGKMQRKNTICRDKSLS